MFQNRNIANISSRSIFKNVSMNFTKWNMLESVIFRWFVEFVKFALICLEVPDPSLLEDCTIRFSARRGFRRCVSRMRMKRYVCPRWSGPERRLQLLASLEISFKMITQRTQIMNKDIKVHNITAINIIIATFWDFLQPSLRKFTWGKNVSCRFLSRAQQYRPLSPWSQISASIQ